ncbi:MAG: Hsp70 family protein, partial [Bacteroidales bacterium]|nr:Hsp70 family protein [Bacteroidales bacterium]
EIKRMRDEAKANEQVDKVEREKADKLNAADAQVFASEKNLKDYGDKIPADKKSRIEDATKKLKEAHQAKNISALDGLMNELNEAWHAASEEMSKAAGAQQGPNPGAGTQGGYGQNTGSTSNTGNSGQDG